MAGVFKEIIAAFSLAAALSSAASAQNVYAQVPAENNVWNPPSPQQIYRPIPRTLTLQEKCMDLVTFPPQVFHPLTKVGFIQTPSFACKTGLGPDGRTALLLEDYDLRDPRDNQKLLKDVAQAAKAEKSLADAQKAESDRQNARHSSERSDRHNPASRTHSAARHSGPVPSTEGSPGKPGEPIEAVRARRLGAPTANP